MRERIKRLIYGKRYSSETYISYLRSIGMSIGDDVTIYVPTKTIIDEPYPWLITIGNHVRIAEGCKILAHDYAWSVLKGYNSPKYGPGGIYGSSGPVSIGNNVFIGMNTIICCNVTIGDNVIIGAGSVVTRDCPAGGVYAGCPAKKIADIDTFMEKRVQAQLQEAKNLAILYWERYKCKPPIEVFHEYFMLFSTDQNLYDGFQEKIKLCGNYEDSINYLKEHRPRFDSFEAFLEYCFDGNE